MGFVGDFLLPLVAGGDLRVGRPLGPRRGPALLASIAALAERGSSEVLALAAARGQVARSLLRQAQDPPLDESAARIGIVVHDLLALGHPRFGAVDARSARMREATLRHLDAVARIGVPQSAQETVYRHTLVVRVGEICRAEHAVDFWLGRATYVGRPVPPRMRALPGLRRVKVTSGQRKWLSEIGLPAGARPVWERIQDAAPLAEALDPLRLDPPLAWHRLLSVVRFPELCRRVAGHVVMVGIGTAGEALAAALCAQQATLGDAKFGVESTVGDVAVAAIRFLAHVFWLHHLSGGEGDPGPVLGAILLAAASAGSGGPDLLFPADVDPGSRLGQGFLRRLAGLRARFEGFEPAQLASARALCRMAFAARAA